MNYHLVEFYSRVLQVLLIRYILCLSNNSQEGEMDEREKYYSWYSW